MYHTSSHGEEEPGRLRPRRCDTLNSGPPPPSSSSRPTTLLTTSIHRATTTTSIPMRAAQISSAIHTVFEARQLVTRSSTAAAAAGVRIQPRPILPAPARPSPPNRISSQPIISPRIQELGDYSASSPSNRNTPPPILGFGMGETENNNNNNSNKNNNNNGPDSSTPNHHPGAMSPLGGGERSSSRNRNPTDADWNQYRGVITRLYWDENLSMPVVRDYMKREYGFDATPRAYKFRFRKWGLRKNIKEHEALEIVSGQRNPNEFWAGNKRVNFERRIARHLEKEGQEVDRLSKADLASLASRVSGAGGGGGSSGSPRRMSGPVFYEELERSFFDVNEWIVKHKSDTDWFGTKLDLGEDENFFPFFTRGLSTLARGDPAQQQSAWADINRAFDHVKGLVASHHPVVYLRLVGRAASFKYYPDSPICLDVCRLLLKHAYELFHQLHPNCHLLQAIWQSQMSIIRDPEFSQCGSMEHSMHVVMTLCGMNFADTREGIRIGSLCIERYVPSAARGHEEDALRATLDSTNGDLTPLAISLAQETRLALSELLITQDRLDEGQRLVEDALAFRDLDAVNVEGKIFWMAELEWRLGKKDASITLLEEALAIVDAAALENEVLSSRSIAEPGIVDGGFGDTPISALHILATLAHRLGISGRGDYERSVRQRLSSILTKIQRDLGCAFTLHLLPFDLEVEMDPEAVKKAVDAWRREDAKEREAACF